MPIVRRALFVLAALSVVTFGWAALFPAPTFACSCAQITIGSLDTTQNQVFVATAGQPTPEGTPMAVERWFAGPGPAPVVTLSPASFGDSAACGVEPFPPGSRWVMSTWTGDPTQGQVQQPTTGLCQPHAPLDSPEGQAMLAEAGSVYGTGSIPEGGGATPTPAPEAPSTPTDPSTMLIVAGVVGIGVVGLGLVYVLGRGRSTTD